MALTISSLAAKYSMSSQRLQSTPQTFLVAGFDTISQNQLVEEETIPEYSPEHFYPVQLGEVINSQFQTVAKLSYGSNHQYVALKIYLHNSFQHRELSFYTYLDNIRNIDIVFIDGRGFPKGFVKGAIKNLLKALGFLYTKTRLDVHPSNLLLGTTDDYSLFQELEEKEFSSPVPRKTLKYWTIYLSHLVKPKAGPLLLSDFGEARLGPGPYAGDMMPIMYRALETLFYIQWGYSVDIWSVELTICAWDLLEGKTLFSARNEDGSFSEGVHFAELIAALGPPPLGLLHRHRNRALEYWDEHGNWCEFAPILRKKTLEAAETKLGVGDNYKFLQFIRRALTWDPKARPTARQLLQDPWLTE
ncbi:kinase domain-containing protein [Colletotrichum somersetense]|nr:kinase domain-containing protein [Colletotrichum somersetense]